LNARPFASLLFDADVLDADGAAVDAHLERRQLGLRHIEWHAAIVDHMHERAHCVAVLDGARRRHAHLGDITHTHHRLDGVCALERDIDHAHARHTDAQRHNAHRAAAAATSTAARRCGGTRLVAARRSTSATLAVAINDALETHHAGVDQLEAIRTRAARRTQHTRIARHIEQHAHWRLDKQVAHQMQLVLAQQQAVGANHRSVADARGAQQRRVVVDAHRRQRAPRPRWHSARVFARAALRHSSAPAATSRRQRTTRPQWSMRSETSRPPH
jgi:hypothetical protein